MFAMRRFASPFRAAFTLVEMLVVIAIMAVLVTITIVSIPGLIESVNYSAAATRVMGALGSAQTAATASRRPTGVAFLFDVRTERYTLLPLQLDNSRAALTAFPTGPVKHAFALSFNPLEGVAPVELPPGTGVFGLAFNHVDTINQPPERARIDILTEDWYAGELFKQKLGGVERVVNPWIFPRSDPRLFFDPGQTAGVDQTAYTDPWDPKAWSDDRERMLKAVRHANSFYIQFAADGSVATSFSQGDNNDPRSAYIEWPDLPIDPKFVATERQPNPLPFDDEAVFDPEFRGRGRTAIAGDVRAPNPEVILRSVSELAIVDLKRMSKETGVAEPWLIHPSTSLAPWPTRRVQLSTGEFTNDPTDKRFDDETLKISRWIDLNAEIIAFNRYTGQAMRR